MPKYITITGCPCTGKTSMLKLIHRELGCQAVYEKVETNPYVQPFYANKKVWSLHLSIFYLIDAIETISLIKKHLESDTLICQDYNFLTHYEVYCKFLYSEGVLSERDFELCNRLNSIMLIDCPLPDMTIYLFAKPTKLILRLNSRNRLNESLSFDEPYLDRLSIFFQNWVETLPYKKCKIDTSEMNLDLSENDRKHVLNIIEDAFV